MCEGAALVTARLLIPRNMDKGLFPRAFCKVVPDFISRDPTQAIVMHADGAGTKSSLAYIYWKKTGDISVWKGISLQERGVVRSDDHDESCRSTRHMLPTKNYQKLIRCEYDGT